jgi:NAD(P)-dependent dehydrogenase (short-subunit alcohol dehydrogenase family)
VIAKRFPNIKALATKADVGVEDDIKAAVDKAVKEFGRLDVMVRNVDWIFVSSDQL